MFTLLLIPKAVHGYESSSSVLIGDRIQRSIQPLAVVCFALFNQWLCRAVSQRPSELTHWLWRAVSQNNFCFIASPSDHSDLRTLARHAMNTGRLLATAACQIPPLMPVESVCSRRLLHLRKSCLWHYPEDLNVKHVWYSHSRVSVPDVVANLKAV